MHTLGLMYTSIRIDQRQLMYLHKLPNRDPYHWTRRTLQTLADLNMGWYKQINETLARYKLPTHFLHIQKMPKPHWKNLVTKAVEKINTERLNEECFQDRRWTEKSQDENCTHRGKNPAKGLSKRTDKGNQVFF